ncbi:MAG: hypothetical protein LBU98_03915 [Alistipes sp.]|jgi:hypothetical protein|nr:hypothetical protein [Alistipes sp.]
MNGSLKYLSEAEVFVDTVFSIESGAGNGNRFYLADYTTMDEFTTDCGNWFEEDNPEYVYSEWWGIPDLLINERWLCPNIFEIRDALQMLDRDTIGSFSRWCTDNGHDIRSDDPMMLAMRYQDHVPPTCEAPVPEMAEPSDDNPFIELLPTPLHLLLGLGFGQVEIFDDNYN